MKRRTRNFMLWGLFLVATVGSGAQAQAPDPAADGKWGDVLTWPLEAINMVVLKNGWKRLEKVSGRIVLCRQGRR